LKFKREITFDPAWDRRSDKPSENYGTHPVEIRFLLKGKRRAVQFVLYTGWHMPEVEKDIGKKHDCLFKPIPTDLGYHSPEPLYAGQTKSCDDCLFTGGPCYYDGSGGLAGPIFEILKREGSEGVWRALEAYYREIFEEDS
jgi:hypothetical protein